MGLVIASEKPVTVYALRDPRDHTAFYVGASRRPMRTRLSSHLNDALRLQRKDERCRVIREIGASGARPEMVLLEVVPGNQWIEAEQFWIAYLRSLGACLTNVSTGGPGAFGTKQTPETQRRRQLAAAGRDVSHLHTPEVRAKAFIGRRVVIGGTEYPSASAAALALGKSTGTIKYWLDTGRGQRLEGPRIKYRRQMPGRASGERHGMAQSIITDGVEYVTITAAARTLGLNISTIFRRLKSGRAQYADKS